MQNRLFDSLTGMIHYFVRPEDQFVLNTLEVLDSDEYLYRLLKQCGYERVVFFEDNGIESKCFAYDELSNLSMTDSKRFMNVDVSNEESVRKFMDDVRNAQRISDEGLKNLPVSSKKGQVIKEKKAIPAYGKCDIKLKSAMNGSFVSLFLNYVIPALQAENAKTAVVMQLDLFDAVLSRTRRDSKISEQEISTQIAGILKNVMKCDTKQKNILVFTATQKDDFIPLLEKRLLHNIHKQIPEIPNRWQGQAAEDVVRILAEQKCIVIADTIGTDEIANLIIRKKIIDRDVRFSSIPISKIYGLSRLLREHLLKIACNFKSIDYVKMKRYVITLCNYFEQKPDFIDEMINICSTIEDNKIRMIDKGNDVLVERISHQQLQLVEFDDERKILAEFDNYVGMDYLKKQVFTVLKKFQEDKKMYEEALAAGKKPKNYPYMNMVFVGPPGTGKTTVADIVARLFCAKGILSKPEYTSTKPADFSSGGHVGVVEEKLGKALDQGNGGVFVIDEFYNFNQAYKDGNLANEAFSAIMDRTDKYKNSMCLILCGYEDKMDEMFREFNDGASRRFPYRMKFESYSTDELMEIFRRMTEDKKIDDETMGLVRKVIEAEKTQTGNMFGNAGFIEDSLIPRIDAEYHARDEKDDRYIKTDLINAFPEYAAYLEENNKGEEEILKELDNYVGMDYLKKQVFKVLKKFQKDKKKYEEALAAGKKPKNYPYMNMIFVGPPGTGKTTVADIVARLFCAKGILPKPESVQVKPANFPSGGYVGVVEEKLGKALDQGNGGVFVIDEFYNFNQPYKDGNLANEAFSVIMDRTDRYKNSMCLILCGYEDKMDEMFSQFNPGALRRFPYRMKFESYSTDELMEIFRRMTEDKRIDDETMGLVRKVIEAEKTRTGDMFGNAGFIEDNLIAKIDMEALSRDEEDDKYTKEDVINAFPQIKAVEERKEGAGKMLKFEKISHDLFDNLAVPYEYTADAAESDLFRLIESAVLFVKTDTGTGTAFLISPDGYALTCNHVIEGANTIEARLRIPGRQGGQDSIHKCKVINAKKNIDMALIRLEGDNFPYIKLAEQGRKIERLEKIMLPGYPFGMRTEKDMTVFTGIIGSGDEQRDANGFVVYNLNIEGKCGNSGAPIISQRDGCVIGVFTGSIINPGKRMTEEINYMHPLDYFWTEFLK